MRRPFLVSLFLLAALPNVRGITPQETEFFEKNIRPVLAEQCYKCHGPDKQKGALRVDSRAAILKGTDDGAVIVPGKPEESGFIKSLRHIGDSKMPEKADKLPDAQIAAMSEWIRMGMPWPENDPSAKAGAAQGLTKKHWSFQTLRKGPPPAAKDPQHWAQSPVDQFILTALEAKHIAPSNRASKRTLIRRATFDLTGLPPTAAAVEAFEKDNAPDAFAKVVDRLLASPRYGERWGRYWLDVARYADTKGYLAGGEERRFAYSYTYRDWVIRAFNEDLPYDQFVIQQIAADRVAPKDDPRSLAAMGFLTLGRRFLNSQPDIIDDRIDTVCRGLMGLTVTCARCHDHKFDPISQKDYYALYGVFASSVEPKSNELPILPVAGGGDDADYQRQLAEREGKVAEYLEMQRRISALRTLPFIGLPAVVPAEGAEKLLAKVGVDELRKLRVKVDELNASPIAPPRPMAMFDSPQPMTPHVFIRGNPGRPGEVVPRRFLSALAGENPPPFKDGSGRLELARAIASKDNPLTARVFANRVWNLHFGAGLVRTPGDFGTKGELPTHPELLDYLATRFMDDGWSVKKLHRLIMLSSAYQQASDLRPDAAQADPENRLVWRMNRRRLDFEALRDSLLATAGQLDATMGGRPVELTTAPFAKRRAVYGLIDRQNLPGLFRTFDFATPDATSPQRHVTTVPQQALFMMNNPFVVDQARAMVAKPQFQQPQAYEEQVHQLYECAFARKAEPAEVDAGLRFVNTALTAPAPEPEKPIWQYGYGAYDETASRVDFHPLPVFSGTAWQGAMKVPDKVLIYALLNAEGGHAGTDSAHSVIRRWTAPADGVVAIAGNIERPSKDGDGILARIISSRRGELFRAEVKPAASVEAKLERVEVKQGETLDFLVDCRGNDNSDGFRWHPLIRGETGEWDAKAQFAGPPKRRESLKAWEQYAQVLLETNEFVFVD